jgi:ribosome-associated heat shock protein Hsp15
LDNPESVRADVWIWAARFFKTRRLGREAIDGGKVEVNGVPCKPAKTVKPGDMLRITRGEERMELRVDAVSVTRGPAAVAQQL